MAGAELESESPLPTNRKLGVILLGVSGRRCRIISENPDEPISMTGAGG